MTRPYISLLISAQAFDDAGHEFSADFCRKLAQDALAMETHFGPACHLYHNWARQMAERSTKIQRKAA